MTNDICIVEYFFMSTLKTVVLHTFEVRAMDTFFN